MSISYIPTSTYVSMTTILEIKIPRYFSGSYGLGQVNVAVLLFNTFKD